MEKEKMVAVINGLDWDRARLAMVMVVEAVDGPNGFTKEALTEILEMARTWPGKEPVEE